MKKFYFKFNRLLCSLILFLTVSASLAQTVCNNVGDLILYTNYDGGTITINVDQNIPNLKIGICTYESCVINLTGAFLSNVVAVRYAGYNGQNAHCGGGAVPTAINGAPSTAVTSTVFAPSATMSNPNGYGSIICGYSCNNTTNQGGCNTVDQIEAYFLNYFSGSVLRSHFVQYNCFGTYSVSSGGNCCPPIPVIPGGISASQTICAGQTPAFLTSTAAATGGAGTITYTWQASTTSTNSGFTNISGANSLTYAPGALFTTTYYRRAASTSTSNISNSNVITVLVSPNPVITFSGPSGVCPGGTVYVNASGASSFTWLPSNTNGSQFTVTALNAGSYTVYGTNIYSCSASAVTQVTLHASPVISVNGPTAVCTGSNAILIATGGVSYNWMPGNLSGSAATVSISTTEVFTVTGTAATGCTNTTTYQLLANPLPLISAVSQDAHTCLGKTQTLTASGASNYTWLPGNSTSNPVVVTPSLNATYTVIGKDQNNCISKHLLALDVHSLPVVNVSTVTPLPVCTGKDLVLASTGAMSYTWMPALVSGAQVTLTATSAMIYTVTGDDGFCTNTNTISISVIPSPTIAISTVRQKICVGENTKLNGGGAITYTWTGVTSNSISVVVSPTVTVTYTLRGTAQNGCDNSSAITVTVSTCSALNEASQKTGGIRLFPNPTTGEFTISGTKSSNVEIIDVSGKLIRTYALKEESNFTVQVKDLSAGTYFVNCPEEGVREKIIVLK